MRRSVRILLIAVACLALPATAQAASPFTAGTGSEPTVAVGSDGSGHVAWETEEESVKVGYCRISPGGEVCNHALTIPFPTGTVPVNSAGRAEVFTPAANKVVVVASCWECPGPSAEDHVYRWISTNNGESFGAPSEIGTLRGNTGSGAWLDGPEAFVQTRGSHVKGEGPALTGGEGVEFASGGTFAYDSAVTPVPGTNKLVAAVNDLETVKYAVYNGSPLTAANINNTANWAINQTLSSPEGDNSDTSLTSGPNGVTLSYLYFRPGTSRVAVRRFDAGTNAFGSPTYVEGSDPIETDSILYPDSFQDPAGRIHVVWETLYDGDRLRYTVSDTSGGNFSTVETLAAHESFYEPEVAAGVDGHGFATWTSGVGGAIRVVPLDPYAESGASPSPSPSPSPAPTPTPTAPKVGGFHLSGKKVLYPGQTTAFRFNASSAGLAVLTFEKRFRGIWGKHKGKKACLPLTRKRLRALRRKAHGRAAFRRLLKRRGCHGFRRIGQIRHRVAQGSNTIRFNGRLAGRKLSPGSYRAKLIVRGSGGLVSRAETVKFKVVAKHHKGKRKKRRHR